MDSLRGLFFRLMKVPADPEPPPGDPASLQTFRASERFFRYNQALWLLKQLSALAGLVWAWFFVTRFGQFGPLGFLRYLEWLSWLAFAWQVPFSYMLLRLDFQLRWYMLSDRSLRIRDGILVVHEKTMAFANIQNITIRQNPLQRLFRIGTVVVRAAGGGSGGSDVKKGGAAHTHEALFEGVDNAVEIRDLIRSRIRMHRDSGLGDPDDAGSLQRAPHAELASRGFAAPVPATTPSRPAIAAARLVLQEVRALRAFAPTLLIALGLAASAAITPANTLHAQTSMISHDSLRDATIERGRTVTRWLFTQPDSLRAVMAPEFIAAVGGPEGVARMGTSLVAQLGEETEVVDEAAYAEGGYITYYRIARHANLAGRTVTSRWIWTGAGGPIIGATVSPTPAPAPTEHAAYETKTSLRLPFDGEWYVAWGGDQPHENYHVSTPDQRFAYDLLVMRDGVTSQGDPRRNESYFCFAQPVLAPAAGRVVTSIDSIADNVPGQMNAAAPPGNHVVIDHGNGEFSLLAHFRQGSVRVKTGDAVTAGQQLGECGNSGNSSEPHLHYHLQTGPAFRDGVGLPAPFREFLTRGGASSGVPVRGQFIRPPT